MYLIYNVVLVSGVQQINSFKLHTQAPTLSSLRRDQTHDPYSGSHS